MICKNAIPKNKPAIRLFNAFIIFLLENVFE